MNRARQATLDWFSQRLSVTELLSLLSGFGLIYVELDNRKPPRQALAEALSRPLASYARWPRVLGLSVVVLVTFQILTGALLALYYLPTPATAHDSVGMIQTDVDFGWLIHQVHHWGSQLLLVVLVARVLRYLAHGIYRAPRELEWLLALGLLLVALTADVSGRLLPWSNDAYWLGVRVVESLIALPVVGPLVGFLLGGEETYLSGLTLIRAYGLHVAIAPAGLLLLIYLHFSSVRRLGLNEIARETRISGTPVLRRHLAEVAMVAVVAVSLLLTLAVLMPRPFPCAADPFATLPEIELPWYLLAPVGAETLTRGLVTPPVFTFSLFLVVLALAALPFVDRGASSRLPRLAIVTVIVVGWLALTFFALTGGS